MAATCVFIGCDVMLLDLFSDVRILVVGGGEENIKVLLKKKRWEAGLKGCKNRWDKTLEHLGNEAHL